MKILFYACLLITPLLFAKDSQDISNPLNNIFNYYEYTDYFSSSGQLTSKQIPILRDNEFERIIYIAFLDQKNAVSDEDRLVIDHGMQFIYIPVEWNSPRKKDFYLFTNIMLNQPKVRTLLHCQANYRASVFSFLHRVINENINILEAKLTLNKIWKPNKVWKNFIFDILNENNISPFCKGCKWD